MKISVEVKRICEGACNCTGKCLKPISKQQKLSALNAEIIKVRNEPSQKLAGSYGDVDSEFYGALV